ncbi:MAG TPA: transcription antitermination factor NusB [Vicinamibacterales bacterium]|nr:transcription antitermination factor NusB [Vicinamibacterales bacterium]
MNRVDPPARRRAREAALQMLYQWEVGRTGPHEAIVTYWPARDPGDQMADELRAFANGLVRGTIERLAEIDHKLAQHATNWRVERMAVIDRLVLRLAVYELLTEVQTPARVIINEAIELARTFSGEEAVPFVNGVLDAVRKELGR